MRPQRIPGLLAWLLLLLVGLASCADVKFGIQRDAPPVSDKERGSKYYSFSGIIEFENDPNAGNTKIDPGNTCQLPDEEFANLVALAWAEMGTLISRNNKNRPGLMAALQYENKIYFASSVKHNWSPEAYAAIDGELKKEGSVGEYMNACLLDPAVSAEGEPPVDKDGKPVPVEWMHRTNAKCAEANVIRLVHEHAKQDFGSPVPNRFAAWQVRDGQGWESGKIAPPCFIEKDEDGKPVDPDAKEGCDETFKERFKLNPIPTNTKKSTEDLGKLRIKVADNKRPSM